MCVCVCVCVCFCVYVCVCTCVYLHVSVCMRGPAKYDGQRPRTWPERRYRRKQFNILKKRKIKIII